MRTELDNAESLQAYYDEGFTDLPDGEWDRSDSDPRWVAIAMTAALCGGIGFWIAVIAMAAKWWFR